MVLSRFCEKEIVSLKTGVCIGKADDFEIDDGTNEISRIVICGKARFFGVLGHGDDIIIPWSDIVTVGEDVILVKTDLIPAQKGKIMP